MLPPRAVYFTNNNLNKGNKKHQRDCYLLCQKASKNLFGHDLGLPHVHARPNSDVIVSFTTHQQVKCNLLDLWAREDSVFTVHEDRLSFISVNTCTLYFLVPSGVVAKHAVEVEDEERLALLLVVC